MHAATLISTYHCCHFIPYFQLDQGPLGVLSILKCSVFLCQRCIQCRRAKWGHNFRALNNYKDLCSNKIRPVSPYFILISVFSDTTQPPTHQPRPPSDPYIFSFGIKHHTITSLQGATSKPPPAAFSSNWPVCCFKVEDNAYRLNQSTSNA